MSTDTEHHIEVLPEISIMDVDYSDGGDAESMLKLISNYTTIANSLKLLHRERAV